MKIKVENLRNPQARKLAGPSCQPRTFRNRKAYTRKVKHRGRAQA